jgi:hypothetical protein
MLDARELRSGKLVAASKARRGGIYECPLCRARVYLRDGSYRQAHFAHRKGEGSDDCERFVSIESPAATPASRALPAPAQRRQTRNPEIRANLQDGEVVFTLDIPPHESASDHELVIEGKNFRRTLSEENLTAGKRIEIPLEAAPWNLAALDGRRSDCFDWLANNLTLWPGPNVFYASGKAGRRLLRNDVAEEGDVLLIVAEDPHDITKDIPSQVTLLSSTRRETVAAVSVALPARMAPTLRSRCESWLAHRIVAPLLRVYVASPLPVTVTPAGAFVYVVDDGPICARTSERARLLIRSAAGRLIAEERESFEITWRNPTPGSYQLVCNGEVREEFLVEQTHPESKQFLRVRCDSEEWRPLQEVIARLQDDRKPAPGKLILEVSNPRVANYVRINNDVNEQLISRGVIEIALGQDVAIAAGALGILSWSPRCLTHPDVSPELRPLGRWLLNTSSRSSSGPLLGLSANAMQVLPEDLVALRSCKWPVELQAQVRWFERLLGT